MAEQHTVTLIGGEDGEQAVFTLIDDDGDCRLRCDYRCKTVESVASDYFRALCEIRVRLADDGLIPFCYGASLNVYPSAMARSMARGLSAYRLAKGKPASMDDLVGIFAEGPDIVPASVEAQEQFYRDCIAAL